MTSCKRAGLLMYNVAPNGDILFRCMIPSDPAYGGTSPQLPKGTIDAGDTAKYTAVKEAVEESGLKYENLKFVKHFKSYASMSIDVFIGEVFDINDFDEPGWEASWSGWVNFTQEPERIRSIQRHIFFDVAMHVEELVGEI